MKLEYLPDGAPDCPLIRLYDFHQSEARLLKQLVSSLAIGERENVALQTEKWVNSVGDCCLVLRRGDSNGGVRGTRALEFEWVMNVDGWRNVEGLLQPFCEENAPGFQWLTHDGRVGLLISRSGQW